MFINRKHATRIWGPNWVQVESKSNRKGGIVTKGEGTFKERALIGLVVGLVLTAGVFLLELLKFELVWPLVLIPVFFFLVGNDFEFTSAPDLRKLLPIVLGAINGMALIYAYLFEASKLVPLLGATWGTLLAVFINFFYIIGFRKLLKGLINNVYALTYFTVSLAFVDKVNTHLQWTISAIIGCAVAVAILYAVGAVIKPPAQKDVEA
ncbi:MAG: hypothetical protein GXY92_08755 [Syntrophomonadaceae bacterium]|nr:hypothetical protein [Syntrophomonadaceae bacterium]